MNYNFFTKLGGSRRNINPPPTPVDIPDGSRIYLQMPGDHVLSGVLRLENANFIQSNIYIPKPNGRSLTANLETLHHESSHRNVQEYRCYIPLPDRSILTAFLHPYSQQDIISTMSVFVRGPVDSTSFVGVLRHIDGYRPEWLPYDRQ